MASPVLPQRVGPRWGSLLWMRPDQTPSYGLNNTPKLLPHLQVIQVLGSETPNPKQMIYIKYNLKEEMNRVHIVMKEVEKIAEITAIEEQRIDMRGVVNKN